MRAILADIIGLKNPDTLKYKDIKTVIIDVTVQPIERPQLRAGITIWAKSKLSLVIH